MTIQQRKANKRMTSPRRFGVATNKNYLKNQQKSIDWGQVGTTVLDALTVPGKQFQNPVAPFEVDFTDKTTTTIYAGAGIIALGVIASALIKK